MKGLDYSKKVLGEIYKIFRNEISIGQTSETVVSDKKKVNQEILERRCSDTNVINYVLLLQDIKNENEIRKKISQAQKSKKLRKIRSLGGSSKGLNSGTYGLLTIEEEATEN
eukprot:CAMPEP_0205805458 /NCGR_PEP_ID=MMETSP0205-20121125/8688_1 /ASSEMBLY_ACC=CAM_ASM_000278 /TAXON_ID=36767 /ORGANISM="Euplotes focardii, Strain TN1" /LENGTH=111 /DNA_ID=CAMNT_0053076709 /DNA_START=140 /DNA_END=475 /DNA_ORIENTATION=-